MNADNTITPTTAPSCPAWCTDHHSDAELSIEMHHGVMASEAGVEVGLYQSAGDAPVVHIDGVHDESLELTSVSALTRGLAKAEHLLTTPGTEPPRPEPTVIVHPSWCTADDDTARNLPGWKYEAPAEADGLHRGRRLHVDHTDVAFTVAYAQPYETDLASGRIRAYEPVIEFVAHNLAVEGTVGAWLTRKEAELLVKHLQTALDERMPSLPVGLQQ